jgi:hypothetical protein
LSPVSPQTNDAHDERTGRLSSSIEVRKIRAGDVTADGVRQTVTGTSSLRSNMLITIVLSSPIADRE